MFIGLKFLLMQSFGNKSTKCFILLKHSTITQTKSIITVCYFHTIRWYRFLWATIFIKTKLTPLNACKWIDAYFDTAGTVRPQYLGFWQSDVPRQSLCTVLLGACVCSNPGGHCCGQTSGNLKTILYLSSICYFSFVIFPTMQEFVLMYLVLLK